MEMVTTAEVEFLDYALERVIEHYRALGQKTGDYSKSDELEDLAFDENYPEIFLGIRADIYNYVALTDEERGLMTELEHKLSVCS